ncbi:hypothetical protein F5148DRAFT_326136 [Russula earlei]|uniref:Uncharacterized protein n=1 Tax=Russula earlei TaxID=71964 RepID=A0ACC0UIV0_9AGAM|nr:hypothetical protein F5148DRAFT_326136 [Russula earlei]
MLARAREVARAPVFTGKKPGYSGRSSISLGGPELETLIKDLFHLSVSDATAERPRPPTPQTPTGRGTPTGGRSTPQLGIQTNGTGTPSHNAHRGGSVMSAYPSFSSHTDLAVQALPTGSTATQVERPVAAAAANKAAPIPKPGPRPTENSEMERTHEGTEGFAGVPSEPEPKGKEAAAEASLDPVMHMFISKRDFMEKVVSDGHGSEPAATQAKAGVAGTKKGTEARAATSSTSKGASEKKGPGACEEGRDSRAGLWHCARGACARSKRSTVAHRLRPGSAF